MSYNLIITSERTKKQMAAVVNMYNDELANIQAEDTRQALANILFERDSVEVTNYKLAYFLTVVTDEMGKAEGYKGWYPMIKDVTGLSKSMIYNYRNVAQSCLIDENGDFFVPDYLVGFTITQMLRGIEGCGAEQFIRDVIEGVITPDMSASTIKKHYDEESNTVDSTATEQEATEQEATEHEATEQEATEKVNPKDVGVFPVYELIDSTGQIVGMVSINKDYDKEGLNKYLKTCTIGKKVG